MENNMRTLLTHPEMGIYVGSFIGLGIWSKLDDGDQPCAVTFESDAEADAVMASWDNLPEGIKKVHVIPDDGNYISKVKCTDLGIEWDRRIINDFHAPGCGFMSNFYACPIVVDGVPYKSSEYYYAASKAANVEDRELIMNCEHPGQAKKLGAKVKIREDWNLVKDGIMMSALKAKFRQPHMMQMLLGTNDAELIEGNQWHDKYWGVCYCNKCRGAGENKLGKMLMELRQLAREWQDKRKL
jgi:ribA/ribD-fused uncharacterized protein